jgi:hypothetical protein
MAADRTGRAPGWRWPLRAAASLLVLMLWTQPLLIGLFLAGDFDKLDAHALVGGMLVGLTAVQFLAAVPAWRPGGLPGWVVALAGVITVGAGVQIAAGYERNLGLHVPLGVTLAVLGVALAIRSWWPTPADQQQAGPRRQDPTVRVDPSQIGPADSRLAPGGGR